MRVVPSISTRLQQQTVQRREGNKVNGMNNLYLFSSDILR